MSIVYSARSRECKLSTFNQRDSRILYDPFFDYYENIIGNNISILSTIQARHNLCCYVPCLNDALPAHILNSLARNSWIHSASYCYCRARRLREFIFFCVMSFKTQKISQTIEIFQLKKKAWEVGDYSIGLSQKVLQVWWSFFNSILNKIEYLLIVIKCRFGLM